MPPPPRRALLLHLLLLLQIIRTNAQPVPSPKTSPCPVILPTTRIVGGTFINSSYLVSLRTTLGACSGTLITRRHVLTAAHCDLDSSARALISSTNGTDGTEIAILQVDDHPTEDIAVVTLARASSVPPVKVLTNPELPSSWSFVRGQGYGRQSFFPVPSDSRQRFVDMPVVPRDLCEELEGDSEPPDDLPQTEDSFGERWLCTGYLESSSCIPCQGDSGGPILAILDDKPVIVGVVSRGNACGIPDSPALSARVTKAIQWLDQLGVNYNGVTELSEIFVDVRGDSNGNGDTSNGDSGNGDSGNGDSGNEGSDQREPIFDVETVQVGLSGGAIAGIVVGGVIGALLIGVVVAFFVIRARRDRTDTGANDGEGSEQDVDAEAPLAPAKEFKLAPDAPVAPSSQPRQIVPPLQPGYPAQPEKQLHPAEDVVTPVSTEQTTSPTHGEAPSNPTQPNSDAVVAEGLEPRA